MYVLLECDLFLFSLLRNPLYCSPTPSLCIPELQESEQMGCILATQETFDYFLGCYDLLVSLVVCLLINQKLRFRKAFSSHHMGFQLSLLNLL